MTLTFEEVLERIPTGPGHGWRGSWVGWFLRMSFAPFIGIDDARDLVIRALGPGHDYLVMDYHGNKDRAHYRPKSNKGLSRSNGGVSRRRKP